MKLVKLGNVFGPDQFGSFSSHAQVPTAVALEKVVRVFYAARNGHGKSFTTFVDLDSNDPTRVVHNHQTPVIGFGNPGTFDEDGVMPSSVLWQGTELWLYYSGWNQKVSTPYHNSTGLAVSRDQGLTFERLFEGPVIERNHLEPYVTVTPTILRENGLYRIWYVSGTQWIDVQGRREPVYVIVSAESDDGIIWRRPGKQVIPSLYPLEAFSRPSVFRKGNLLHMLFCSRGSEDYRDGAQGYKLGYAFSIDGERWTRDDKALMMGASTGDWESKMNCYPFYVNIGGSDFIFYNGNGFGKSGFGLARLEGIRT